MDGLRRRQLFPGGELQQLVEQAGVCGVTTHPAKFERAIGAPTLRRGITAAVAAGNAAELRRHAHLLKGTLGLFPLPRGLELTQRLELLRKSGDLTAAPELQHDLEVELDRLRGALDRHLEGDLATLGVA